MKAARLLARKVVSITVQGWNGESRMTRDKLNFFVYLGLLSLPAWAANQTNQHRPAPQNTGGNMKTLREMIEVMEAAERGEEIEALVKDKWQKCDCPGFDWIGYDFRVKPKPREFWLVSVGGWWQVQSTNMCGIGQVAIKVREVIE
jgi:hypothetical protein